MSGQSSLPRSETNQGGAARDTWWRAVVGGLAFAAVVGCGVLLGRVLLSEEWTIAVTVVGLGTLVLALLLDPVAGLLLCVALTPFAPYIHLVLQLGRRIPELDVTRLTVLLLTARLVAQAMAPGPKERAGRPPLLRLTWLDLAMVLFAGAMFLSVPASALGLVDGAQTVFSFAVLPLLFYYFARTWSRTPNTLLATIGVLGAVGLFLGLITAREQLTGQTLFSQVSYSLVYEGKIRKVLSVFRSPTTMSSALAVMAPMLLFGIQWVSKWGKRLWLATTLSAVLGGVFYAYVRGGWLGAVLGIAVLVVLDPRLRRTLVAFLPLVVIVAVLLSGIALIDLQVVQNRLASEQPITYRLQALNIALDLVRQSPLLGVGFENFGKLALRQFGWDPHGMETTLPSTHNSYVYVLVAGGLLAFLPYMATFAGLAWRGYAFWPRRISADRTANNRALVAALWATLAAYLAVIVSFDVMNAQYTNIVFFVIMGTLQGNLEQANEEVVG